MNGTGSLWREQVHKALVGLCWYLGIAVSLALAIELVRFLLFPPSTSHTQATSTYVVLVEFALLFWIVRQFIRFWYTVFVVTRRRY